MEENQQSKEIEIDLREVLAELWSHALIIVLAAAVVGIAVFLFTSLLVTPQYTSETRVFILNILQLVTCRPVLENVITDLGLDMTTRQLESEISVSNPSDTRFIVIRVEDMDPYQAQEIADAVRIAAAEQITEIMDIEAVNTVEEASMPTSKSSPSTMRDTMLGFIVGALIAMIGIVLNYMFNDTIKTSEDIEKYLNLSVLGVIPKEQNVNGDKGRKRKISAAKRR